MLQLGCNSVAEGLLTLQLGCNTVINKVGASRGRAPRGRPGVGVLGASDVFDLMSWYGRPPAPLPLPSQAFPEFVHGGLTSRFAEVPAPSPFGLFALRRSPPPSPSPFDFGAHRREEFYPTCGKAPVNPSGGSAMAKSDTIKH